MVRFTYDCEVFESIIAALETTRLLKVSTLFVQVQVLAEPRASMEMHLYQTE
jgi:hypothetical protein